MCSEYEAREIVERYENRKAIMTCGKTEEIEMRNRNESDVVCIFERAQEVAQRQDIQDIQDEMYSQDVVEAMRRVEKLRIQMNNLASYRFADSKKMARVEKARDVLRPQLLALETVLEGLL